jgi:hypothetical protein
MAQTTVDSESVMAVDLGSINTRAMFFDVVDSQYHFVATGVAPSTIQAPFQDVGESVHQAFLNLQETTGQVFLDRNGRLIIPSQPDGSGVDRLVVIYSGGPELRIVVAGLLSDVSLESVQHLAATTYGRVVESIGLNDKRRPEMRLDAIIKAEPDLIIMAGGTENGATRSINRLAELVSTACKILPAEKRPEVVFAGNSLMAKNVKEIFEKTAPVNIAPNVRPSIDVEELGPASETLARVVTQVRSRQFGGMQLLSSMCSAPPLPSAFALGRMVRFLSQLYDPIKGVLGVDIGSNSTSIAAAVGGKLALNVFPLGVGSGAPQVLQLCRQVDVSQWLASEIPDDVVQDYIWQKGLEPARVPVTPDELAIEQALTRQLLRMGIQYTLSHWPGLTSAFEPYLISGAVFAKAPSPAQSLMMVLDGLQPVGITAVYLDQNGLAPALGAIAGFNSVLPVQVMDSGVFLNLGTVICPVSDARFGTPILNVRLEYEQGTQNTVEITQGTLTSLPLQPGQTARIHLEAGRNVEVDPRGKRGSGSFKIVGGICGAVIDARGRPLVLPADGARRRDLLNKWAGGLGF